MAESPPNRGPSGDPLVVHAQVGPWGFLIALPFAMVLAYLGAWALDLGFEHDPFMSRLDKPLWLFSVPLLGFALFLFVVGVGELARYIRPAVEAVIDEQGVTTYGDMGARRIAWSELIETRIDSQHVSLRARHKGMSKTVRLHFDRLDVEPARLVRRIEQHRPDVAAVIVSGSPAYDRPIQAA
ncbi:MAG: hypothetical protein AB7L90_01960 [Hyphomicrobiaceae bacterium]